MPYPGFYSDGEVESECMIIRMGRFNSRIQLLDDTVRLVPSDSVRRAKIIADVQRDLTDVQRDLAKLILPITPLEMFYRQLRKCKGTK